MKPLLTTALMARACSLSLAADPVEIQTKATMVREMSTDRPDQTEGAFTVPKGWFQVAMGLLSFSQRLDTDNCDISFAWSEMNVKNGRTGNTDVKFIWGPDNQTHQKNDPGTDATNLAGTVDLTARFKWNLVGNDGGPLGMSVLPDVKIPTATHHLLTENLMLDLSVFWFFHGDESIQPLVGLSWSF
jgi:hypothetical protein